MVSRPSQPAPNAGARGAPQVVGWFVIGAGLAACGYLSLGPDAPRKSTLCESWCGTCVAGACTGPEPTENQRLSLDAGGAK
jgi:hypothetical protein